MPNEPRHEREHVILTVILWVFAFLVIIATFEDSPKFVPERFVLLRSLLSFSQKHALLPVFIITAAIMMTAALALKSSSRKIASLAPTLESKLDEVSQHLNQAINEITIAKNLMNAKHDFFVFASKLSAKPMIEAKLISAAKEIIVVWEDLCRKIDRDEFWSEVLQAYMDSEVRHIGKGIIATDCECYSQLLQALIRNNLRPGDGILQISVVNNVLPEQWFNWPDTTESASAPDWLYKHRGVMTKLAGEIDGGADVQLERITLVVDDNERSHGFPIRPFAELNDQAKRFVIASIGDKPFEAGYLRNHLTDHPKYLPKDNKAKCYYVSGNPVGTLGTPQNVVRRFIDELHPKSVVDSAKYKVLGMPELEYVTDEQARDRNTTLPFDFVMLGTRKDMQSAPIWFCAITAVAWFPEKHSVRVKICTKQDLSQLASWFDLLKAGALHMSSLVP